jgi:hypothetical protein
MGLDIGSDLGGSEGRGVIRTASSGHFPKFKRS